MASYTLGKPGTESLSIDMEFSVKHLQAELARIDVLVHRQVYRWQKAGQDPMDAFRGIFISDAKASGLAAQPLYANWGDMVELSAEEAEQFQKALTQAGQQAHAIQNAAHCQGSLTRLEHLAMEFDLTAFDLDALLVCLAPCLDLRYERLYGYLQDDISRKRPGVNLILDLLCPPGPERWCRLEHFASKAPLLHYHLLEWVPEAGTVVTPPLISRTLEVDETIVAWLLGAYQPGHNLAQNTVLSFPVENSEDQLLAGNGMGEVLLSDNILRNRIYIFNGLDRTAQTAAARLLAVRVGQPLLAVHLNRAVGEGTSALAVLQQALRDANLIGAVPWINGWDACLVENEPPDALLEELYSFPGTVVVTGRKAWRAQEFSRDRRLCQIEFGVPDCAQRRALWQHFLGKSANLNPDLLETLAGQFALTSGQIREAITVAMDRDPAQPQPSDLLAAARSCSNPGLAALAIKLAPRYGWKDIVLPPDPLALLKEIVAAVRGRPRVLDEWGVGKKLVPNRGVTVLFSGPPGTGKTMAAEIIAGELGLDLYKIDLSTVVSKYVGETEKNLERIFHEAGSSNAILFFDEADALFGRRSEVRDSHDRYANIEISYLLQRMEMHDGITILATNLRANLDEAFTRRLQYTVDFPFPDEADRLRIWVALFPPGVPRTDSVDLPLLAERFKLAGGGIRNALVGAAYLAASDGQYVTMRHLLHSVRREMQKMGRLIDEEELSQP